MILPPSSRFHDTDGYLALYRLVKDGQPKEQNDAPDAHPRFVLYTLLDDVARHKELDLETLTHHVRQSDATAANGYWHASITEARSFLEALLVSILCMVCDQPADKQKSTLRDATPFRYCLRRLREAGFLDANENDLLQYVHRMASCNGSHDSVIDEAWARLVRRMVWATGQYLLTCYEMWKSIAA